MVLIRPRPRHMCQQAWICVAIVAWDGIARPFADNAYESLRILGKVGIAAERACEKNKEKTCRCQGIEDNQGGASFTYGCAVSMYMDFCKFARSPKYKGKDNIWKCFSVATVLMLN